MPQHMEAALTVAQETTSTARAMQASMATEQPVPLARLAMHMRCRSDRAQVEAARMASIAAVMAGITGLEHRAPSVRWDHIRIKVGIARKTNLCPSFLLFLGWSKCQ